MINFSPFATVPYYFIELNCKNCHRELCARSRRVLFFLWLDLYDRNDSATKESLQRAFAPIFAAFG